MIIKEEHFERSFPFSSQKTLYNADALFIQNKVLTLQCIESLNKQTYFNENAVQTILFAL